jgi:hypothetical protein
MNIRLQLDAITGLTRFRASEEVKPSVVSIDTGAPLGCPEAPRCRRMTEKAATQLGSRADSARVCRISSVTLLTASIARPAADPRAACPDHVNKMSSENSDVSPVLTRVAVAEIVHPVGTSCATTRLKLATPAPLVNTVTLPR